MNEVSSDPSTVKPTETFTGDVYLTMLKAPTSPSRLAVGRVHFTPGARTFWHRHAQGQTLVVLEGSGLVGTRDGTVQTFRAGDTVWCPADEDHWHGAGPETSMTHLSLTESDEGSGATWLEPVTDEQYAAPVAG